MATRQIQLTMDETVLPRVVEALGALHGYTDALEREPTLTPAAFTKRVVAGWVMSQVDLYEARKATTEAGRLASEKVRAEVVIS